MLRALCHVMGLDPTRTIALHLSSRLIAATVLPVDRSGVPVARPAPGDADDLDTELLVWRIRSGHAGLVDTNQLHMPPGHAKRIRRTQKG